MHLVIHGRNVEIPTQLIELAGKRLQYALGRLAHLVGRINVRIQDENGPRGGVDTDQLSSKTMETKTVPGLFWIGEVVDVTGWLGGYNFQWAWASGWAAGQAV